MESSVQLTSIDPSAVQAKAYELWEKKGRPDGVAEQTWHEAEQLLQLEVSRATKQARSERVVTQETSAEPQEVETRSDPDSTSLEAAAPTSDPPSSPQASGSTHKKSSNNGRRARR